MIKLGSAGAYIVFTASLAMVGTGYAVSPAEKCEATKLGTAGKYDFCRLRAEAKAVKTGSSADFTKCNLAYSAKWTQAEANAGGMCPSNGDEAALEAFISEDTDAITAALDGGALPQGVLSCNANLGTCNSNYASCSTNLTTCNGNLNACDMSLTTVSAGTAVQPDVLSGKTFSSGSGLGLVGTMPNNGAVNLVPGTVAQSIPVGYHNGSGSVVGDSNLVGANIRSGLSIFGVTGTLSSGAGLKTGQTTAYGTGTDGNLQKGTSRSYTDNGDGTITDNVTGLMWEKKDQSGQIHDWSNIYTWGMTSSPYTINGTIVTTFLAALNAGAGFAGHTDWRIPNVNELQGLVNYQNVNPSVDTAFNTNCTAGCSVTTCSCTSASFVYWSSSTDQNDPSYAWMVGFYVGGVDGDSKSVTYCARAVRGGA